MLIILMVHQDSQGLLFWSVIVALVAIFFVIIWRKKCGLSLKVCFVMRCYGECCLELGGAKQPGKIWPVTQNWKCRTIADVANVNTNARHQDEPTSSEKYLNSLKTFLVQDLFNGFSALNSVSRGDPLGPVPI